MKKIVTILFLLTLMSFARPVSAASADEMDHLSDPVLKLDYPLIREDGSVSDVTICEIDRIIFERNRAILAGEMEKAEQYHQQLLEEGCRISTVEELEISGVRMDEDRNTLERGISSVSYTTTIHTVSVNGTNYQVKRITAYPTTGSNLFHSAVIGNKTISSSVASGAYKLLNVIGESAIGNTNPIIGGCITAYNCFKNIISGFASDTVVYGITASYTCAALEQVSFYQYLSNGYWTPFASSSYVQTAISSTVFSTNYSGGSQNGLNLSVNAIQDTVYSPFSLWTDFCDNYYYDMSSILSRYFSTYQFDKKSQITHVAFFHNANGPKKIIEMLGMVCPTTTNDVY